MAKEDKLVNEVYDILSSPEYQQLFIRMMADLIARYIMIARSINEEDYV